MRLPLCTCETYLRQYQQNAVAGILRVFYVPRLAGAIHETGHALYEQGRNLAPGREGLPVNSALSMGVHESQSLLWERMVGLSKPFAHYLLPLLQVRRGSETNCGRVGLRMLQVGLGE